MFKAGEYTFPLGVKTYVMGILNYTPDSFSDGGLHNTPEKAIEHALLMKSQGADIIDLGANSTRPGCEILSAEQELERLKPALEVLKGKLDIPVSVDTFYPECAEYALNNGAVIINDVSGTFNDDIAQLVKKAKGAYLVMHNPSDADNEFVYPEGVIADVRSFFLSCIEKASACGLGKEHLCLDPGLGFGKTMEDNYEITANMNWLKFGGIALLAGASRKRMTNVSGTDAPEDRDCATVAAHTLCIQGGADIIRVHNVPFAVKSAALADKVCRKVR